MIAIDLSGKCALITGASQGIGRACAEWLARAGAAVALVARNEENLNEVAAGIRASGGRAEVIPADLTEYGKSDWSVEETIRSLGGLDIVVLVAGVSRRSDPADTTDEDIDLAIDLKLRSAVAISRAATPHLKARGGGSIVFIAGLSHTQTTNFHGSGSIANAGIMIFKHHLSRRLAPEGIRVNMVNPGATKTPRMVRQVRRVSELSGKSVEAVEAERLAQIPMGRFATADDVAKAVVFLCSDLAAYVTGESINVDGGSGHAVRM